MRAVALSRVAPAVIAVAIHIAILSALLDSARVRDLISGNVVVTAERGRVTFMTRAGAMFVVRVTKPGYEGVKLRLPNEVSESAARNIRLAKLPADTAAH